MKDTIIKKSEVGQFEKGVFANRDFKKGEIVVKYNLRELSDEEFDRLVESEKAFVHKRDGKLYLYSIPERYVNHSDDPNTVQDFDNGHDIALRDIGEGEEITTNSKKEDF